MKQVYCQIDMHSDVLSHECDVEDGFLFTELKYSNNGWGENVSGKTACKIEDDGNGVVIYMEGLKKLKLDYSQAQQLFILLLHTNKEKIEIRESKLIKSVIL